MTATDNMVKPERHIHDGDHLLAVEIEDAAFEFIKLSGSIETANKCPHRRTGHRSDVVAALLKHLYCSDMGNATGSAAAQHKGHVFPPMPAGKHTSDCFDYLFHRVTLSLTVSQN